MKTITQTQIHAYPLLSRGKVRDIYAIDNERLLIITTDRMSAFDVIMQEPIPYKGVILNQITLFWLEQFGSLLPNHILSTNIADFPKELLPYKEELEGRSVIVKRAQPLPVECIVRGYITGSGWKDYQKTGTICGQTLPKGIKESAKLEPAIFTPSTKATLGAHDENINRERCAELLGQETAAYVEKMSLDLYEKARNYAAKRGIIVADTKFEFGFVNGTLHLIDEVLTPDSSRFWPQEGYAEGKGQPSFDKQYLRDWLKAQPWNMQPPPPSLPADVIAKTAQKYRDAYTILTGRQLDLPLS